MEKPYRKNVGIMLINDQNKIWAGLRADKRGWQMPQGGIDSTETPLHAAYRETYEEIGIPKSQLHLIAKSTRWYTYDFPATQKTGISRNFKGQTQKWFLFRFLGQDADFDFHKNPDEIEFSSFKWTDSATLLRQVVFFKKPVYQQVIDEFLPLFPALNSD